MFILCFLIVNPSQLCREWFKGADATSMLIYLEKKLGDELPNIPSKDRPYLQHMYGAACSANRFLRAIYHSPFWLSNEEQVEIISQGRKCTSGDFMQCAECAFKQNLTRWKLQTKFHSLGDIFMNLKLDELPGIQMSTL